MTQVGMALLFLLAQPMAADRGAASPTLDPRGAAPPVAGAMATGAGSSSAPVLPPAPQNGAIPTIGSDGPPTTASAAPGKKAKRVAAKDEWFLTDAELDAFLSDSGPTALYQPAVARVKVRKPIKKKKTKKKKPKDEGLIIKVSP